MTEQLDIDEFDKIVPMKGKNAPVFSLRNGYFRINSSFKKRHGLQDKKAVEMRSKLTDDKIIVALRFLNKVDEGMFSLSHYPRNDSATFSGRSLFMQYNKGFEDAGNIKNIKFRIQENGEQKYFIFEIPLKE